MADEERPAEGDELVLTPDDEVPPPEGAAPPEEVPQGDDAPPPAPSVEELAQRMGWKPKEQFRGDPDKWRPADEFILQGHEIQRSLSSDPRPTSRRSTRATSTPASASRGN